MKSKLVSKITSLVALSLFATMAYSQVGAVGLNSQSTIGTQGNAPSGIDTVDSSSTGRFVVFTSLANNLVAGDANGATDVFVRDNFLGTTTLVSVSSAGNQANAASSAPCISSDGRFVAFVSFANNLVAGDANGLPDIFQHDLVTGATIKVSENGAGGPTNGPSFAPTINNDGRFVAYQSSATNIVAGDGNGVDDIFVHDNLAGTNARASLDAAGNQSPLPCTAPSISGDGLRVVFECTAPLVGADANGAKDIYMRQMGAAGQTLLISLTNAGGLANSFSQDASISADGTSISFTSLATNLTPGGSAGFLDVYVRDLNFNRTVLISQPNPGGTANQNCGNSSISDNGRYVSFNSTADNLLGGAPMATQDQYFYDRIKGKIQLSSCNSAGIEGNAVTDYGNISGDGRFVNFGSFASNLYLGDANGLRDVFQKYARSASTTVYGIVHFTLTQADPNDYTLTFDIKNPAGVVVQTIPNVSVSPDGFYFFDTLLTGPHRLVVKSSTFLSEANSYVLPLDGEVNFNFTLRNGDTVPDNVVDLTDFIAILIAFNSLADADLVTPGNQPSPNWNPAADLNRDGTVDLTDYTSIVVNFNEVGIV